MLLLLYRCACFTEYMDDDAADPLNWAEELTTLLDELEETPDGFGLYLNFMYRYNVGEDGEVDVDSPYKDDIDEIKGEDSQTKFLLEAVATKYDLQMQYAFIKDPTTDVEAGYHYGLFYLGDDIVDTFVAVRAELEVNLSRLHELKKDSNIAINAIYPY